MLVSLGLRNLDPTYISVLLTCILLAPALLHDRPAYTLWSLSWLGDSGRAPSRAASGNVNRQPSNNNCLTHNGHNACKRLVLASFHACWPAAGAAACRAAAVCRQEGLCSRHPALMHSSEQKYTARQPEQRLACSVAPHTSQIRV